MTNLCIFLENLALFFERIKCLRCYAVRNKKREKKRIICPVYVYEPFLVDKSFFSFIRKRVYFLSIFDSYKPLEVSASHKNHKLKVILA